MQEFKHTQIYNFTLLSKTTFPSHVKSLVLLYSCLSVNKPVYKLRHMWGYALNIKLSLGHLYRFSSTRVSYYWHKACEVVAIKKQNMHINLIKLHYQLHPELSEIIIHKRVFSPKLAFAPPRVMDIWYVCGYNMEIGSNI